MHAYAAAFCDSGWLKNITLPRSFHVFFDILRQALFESVVTYLSKTVCLDYMGTTLKLNIAMALWFF